MDLVRIYREGLLSSCRRLLKKVFPDISAVLTPESPVQSDPTWSFMSRAGTSISDRGALAGRPVDSNDRSSVRGSSRVLAALMTLVSILMPGALAAPGLPSSALASQAIRAALTPSPLMATGRTSAAATRAQGVSRAANSSASRSTGRSATVHSTAYNSTPGQTDSTPYITATGTRVRVGVVALSRDLLGRFPYGTRITIEDLSGTYSSFLRGRVFVVEDTMHPRIGNTVDVWMGSRSEALAWGSRNIRITAVQ